MSADSPRRHPSGVVGSGIGSVSGPGSGSGGSSSKSGGTSVPAIVPPQTVSDRSILDSAIGFINDVTLANQPVQDPKDTITWARFETGADVSDPRFGDDWELEGNAAPPLLLILGYGLGVQVWAIPANGEAVEVLSWRHGVVTALRVLPTPATAAALDENGRADEPVDAFAEKRPLVALVDGGSAAASGLLAGGSGLGGGGGVTTVGGSGGGVGGIGVSAAAQFSGVNFMSLKTGVQVKTIKFKNAVLDIQANRSAVVITFHERIAVFDARTLEDRLTITTCYPSPGINPNPIALGPRWLAYAEHKLLHSKRSGGGCDGEGVPSYTATVLNAAKSLGKGLRELGEQVAAGLTGTTAGSGASSKSSSFDSASGGQDAKQSGVVTIIDVKHPVKDYSPTTGTPLSSMGGSQGGGDPIVAHFVAHSEALVAMEFDSSGMLLLTADRRGHDFHVFRVQPHPVGPSLAAVHHLYVLHRGDTSAKVQHIAFSLDSRWAAVSTLRGTTHVFPITPYGGAMGVRTHTSLHVVNKLSRFHRSAGLGADGRSSSPISHSESTTFVQSLQPYHNPTLPPYPRPSVVQPLAQLRQPFTLGSPPGSAGLGVGGGVSGGGGGMGTGVSSGGHGGVGVGSSSQRQRQRLSSLSDDSGKPLSVCSIFAKSRSWLLEPPMATREQPHRVQRKAVDSLFVMAGHGALIQYDLDTKLASHVAKEKICDDTPIELEVEARAQWNLGRRRDGSQEIIPPLSLDNWLIKDRHASLLLDSAHHFDEPDERAESWLAQVEIITHAGPHRRLWMGPQFVFKNYNTPSGSNLNHVDAEAVEIGVTKTTTTALPSTAAASSALGVGSVGGKDRSSPLNMPLSAATSVGGGGIGSSAVTGRSGAGVPVLIESGSYSSIEQSPKLMDRFRHGHLDSDYGHGDTRLKEDLADAMRESPSTAAARRETTAAPDQAAPPCGDHLASSVPASADQLLAAGGGSLSSNCDNACYYDALAEHETLNDLDEVEEHQHQPETTETHLHSMDSISALASVLPNICSYSRVEKMVNPLGTVTDLNAGISGELQTDMLDEVVGQLAAEESVIHENCDEALFRPVVAIFCSDPVERQKLLQKDRKAEEATPSELDQANCQPPVVLVNKLIVPVIAKEVDEVLVQKEKQKSQKQSHKAQQQQQQQQKTLRSLAAAEDAAQAQKFAELSHLNKPKGNINNSKTASQKSGSGTSEDEGTTTAIAKSAKKAKSNKQKTSGKVSERKPESKNPEQDKIVAEEEMNVQEEDSDPESDHADSLLANKSSIAAVMVSSASAQGLSLHVETSAPDAEDEDEDEEVEEEQEHETDKEPPQIAKKKQQPGGAVATMTIDKEKEKAKEKELKLKEKEREAKLKEKEKEERLKLKEREEKIKEKEREEKLKEEKIKEKEREEKLKEKQREEKIKEEKIKEKEREEKIKEKEREEKIKEKEREEKLKEKRKEEKLMEEKIKEKEREEKLKERQREEKIKEKEREEKVKKEREERIKKDREEKLKEKERAERIKEKEEKLKEKEREEKLEEERIKEKEREEKIKEREEQLKKKAKEEKLKEKEREEKLKEQERLDKLKEKEQEEKLKAKELEEKLKEREREERLKEKEKSEKEAKLKEKEEQKEKENKLRERKEKEKVKEKEKPLETEKPLIPANVTSPWRRVIEETPPKLPAAQDYPSLGKKPIKMSPEKKRDEKLLPGLTTPPKEVKDNFEDFLCGLKPLDALPPLPALEPLEVKGDSKKDPVSLINFESPLQENAAIPRKISPPPRGFTEQNLILALCGSLHYENEQNERMQESEPEAQAEMETTPEPPVYISLDALALQKSTSTSNNSSGSEEIVIMEEPVKKLSKKHKRLKHLQLQQQQLERDREPDDEELRPLISISMCDSQLDVQDPAGAGAAAAAMAMPDDDDDGVREELHPKEPEQSLPEDLLHFGSSGVAPTIATTTDSDGPLPATTSDDNLVYGSSTHTTQAAPHKLKTKKLEHKINLIAAIEAATSSSTSSAEESSVETTIHPDPTGLGLGIGLPSHSAGGAAGAAGSMAMGAATSSGTSQATATGGVTSVGLGVGVASPPSATKKKTKRRKR
ncbi:LOW QUALITY PROTEIN: uncharacterized protein LOC128264225 [Drosophila gunungcola]|uniref:LOW QUALITY PROTEIN: uncharacterized protein LOC128264225 n=1 Tax=Drosophila gunungcola TaxID=103775 RepID=UPI0022DEBADF|nr:LOW QUALITY PROTEIN: uncharacterized protein LOC128264225 [Drosophila gunungcola]